PRSGVARFNSDGSFDPSYNPGGGLTMAGVAAYGSYAVRQSDNKVIITGQFDAFDGHPVPGLVRLNTDGSFDSTFNPGTGTSSSNVFGLFVQAAGRLNIVAGPGSFRG